MKVASVALVLTISLALGVTAQALDPCYYNTSRYLAYNVDTPSNGPMFMTSFNEVGCSTRKFHANYSTVAVGRLRVYGSAPSSVACTSMKVRVTNGALQNGSNITVYPGTMDQSLVDGSVLAVRFETLSPFGTHAYSASWAHSTACPV
jgi:hypothetical protein